MRRSRNAAHEVFHSESQPPHSVCSETRRADRGGANRGGRCSCRFEVIGGMSSHGVMQGRCVRMVSKQSQEQEEAYLKDDIEAPLLVTSTHQPLD